MKRWIVFLLLMVGTAGLAVAQYASQLKNLTRNVVTTVEGDKMVNPREFQMELVKGARYNDRIDNPWFHYVYAVSDHFGRTVDFVSDGPNGAERSAITGVGDADLRVYKIGPSYRKSILVLKNTGGSIGLRMVDSIPMETLEKGKEVVLARGFIFPVCDSVLYLDDDSYVYSIGGRYYRCKYNDYNGKQTPADQIVWKKKYELVRTEDMPYSVLVVKGQPYELFDVYDEDNFRIKFSYDGSRWMAVGKECYWVDGVMHSVKGYVITDFAINDKGVYGYTAYKQDAPEGGETVVLDGKMICQETQVCYFGLNEIDDFKLRFVDGNRCYQYEYGNVTDVTDEMASVYYPNSWWNIEPTVVYSPDRLHKLTYRSDPPAVKIDGVIVSESVPCFALFDERSNAFLWNAVESRNGKTELVIYKYVIPKNLFKKLFN